MFDGVLAAGVWTLLKNRSLPAVALLDIAQSQSVLIDETRLARRLRGTPSGEQPPTIAEEGRPPDAQRLLEEMEEAVRSGKELLRRVRNETALPEVLPAPGSSR
ncbi:MAG: hypothetical protein GY842_26995 [bacterium]|nr:hypothetical protein [bacterium]